MLSDVQGQTEGVRFLRRIVDGSFRSPLMLVGPEGVGKRFAVLEAAKERFSLAGGEEYHVTQIMRGIHPDVHLVTSVDGKDIGISDIREVIALTASFPCSAPVRFVVIDGAERLTDAAANALLKTLEEPHPTTQFFLLTENAQRVLPTIRSRCGELRFRTLPEKFVVEFLREHTDDPSKALVYARISEGSVGRALQYLGSGRLTLRDEMLGLIKVGLTGDLSSLFSAVGKISSLKLGLRFLEHILYDLTMLPFDSTALTNVDIVRELDLLRPRLGETRLWQLVDGVRAAHRLPASINLSYHIKSHFASVFSG